MEPDEPFLRTFKSFDQQQLQENHIDPFPIFGENQLQASDKGCALIIATAEPKDIEGRQDAEICVYFTEGGSATPAIDVLAAIMKNALETRDIYHTTRQRHGVLINGSLMAS